jgi:sugar/nucleoside kinase (ribokinase family)
MNKPDTKSYDLLFAGNLTRDTVITPQGTTVRDGGAVIYGVHAAARLGARTAVVARLGKDDRRADKGFLGEGIDFYPVFAEHSTLLTLHYPTGDPDTRTLSVTATAGRLGPADIAGLEARGNVISGTLREEAGLDFFQAARLLAGEFLAVDVQGFVRDVRGDSLVHTPWQEMTAVLALVDILKSDKVEAEFLTGETYLGKASRSFTDLGPREILLTHRDGLMVYAGGREDFFPFTSKSQIGRSGRGDTCLGAYAAMRLTLPPHEAGKWAAAAASLKVERPVPLDRTRDELAEFIQKHYGC